jgi:3-phenylpropionate/cinnamic acid dioxygenase small subunit
MGDTDQLQYLQDRLAIDDLLTRYARAIDGKDYSLLDTCFTPDAHIDYTSSGGAAGSYPEVRDWLEKTLAMFTMTQHSVTNRHVEITGDTASSHSHFYNPMRFESGQMFTVGGYYHDRLVRTAEGWRIVERIEESAWTEGL